MGFLHALRKGFTKVKGLPGFGVCEFGRVLWLSGRRSTFGVCHDPILHRLPRQKLY